MKKIPLAALYAILLLQTASQGLGQSIRSGSCVVDAEIWTLPTCAVEEHDGHQYISKQYLPLFSFKQPLKLASINITDKGWVYFNQQGLIVIQDVAPFDNGASPFHNDLVRVVRHGKYGLKKLDGTTTVPMIYDGMLEPEQHDEHWKACTGCLFVKIDEYGFFKGGTWYSLDRNGKHVTEIKPPPEAQ